MAVQHTPQNTTRYPRSYGRGTPLLRPNFSPPGLTPAQQAAILSVPSPASPGAPDLSPSASPRVPASPGVPITNTPASSRVHYTQTPASLGAPNVHTSASLGVPYTQSTASSSTSPVVPVSSPAPTGVPVISLDTQNLVSDNHDMKNPAKMDPIQTSHLKYMAESSHQREQTIRHDNQMGPTTLYGGYFADSSSHASGRDKTFRHDRQLGPTSLHGGYFSDTFCHDNQLTTSKLHGGYFPGNYCSDMAHNTTNRVTLAHTGDDNRSTNMIPPSVLPPTVTQRKNSYRSTHLDLDTQSQPVVNGFNAASNGPFTNSNSLPNASNGIAHDSQYSTYTSRDIRHPHTYGQFSDADNKSHVYSNVWTPAPADQGPYATQSCDMPRGYGDTQINTQDQYTDRNNYVPVPHTAQPGLPVPHLSNSVQDSITTHPGLQIPNFNSSYGDVSYQNSCQPAHSGSLSLPNIPVLTPNNQRRVHFEDSNVPQLNTPVRHQWIDDSPIIYSPDGQPMRSNLPWSSTPNSFVRPARPTYQRKFVKWTLKFDKNKCNLHRYVQHFETHASLNQYTEEDKCNQILDGFGHEGSRIIARLGLNYTYASLRSALFKYFEPEEGRAARTLQFQNSKRVPKQSPREFANKLDDLARLSFESISQDELDKLVIRQFIHGHSSDMVPFLLACRFTSIDQAVNHVEMMENMPGANKTPVPQDAPRPSYNRPMTATAAYVAPSHDTDIHIAEVDGILDVLLTTSSADAYPDEDSFCEILASQVYRRFPQAASQTDKCFYCGIKGHRWLQCYKLRTKLQQNGLKTPMRQTYNQAAPRPQAPGRGRGRGNGRSNNFQGFKRAFVNMFDTYLNKEDYEDVEGEEETESKN